MELQNMLANYELQIGCYDEVTDTVTYYGQDRYLHLDGEGHLLSDFDGSWVFLNDQPLSIDVVSQTPAGCEYRAHVLHNGAEAYLMLMRDIDTDALAISGIRIVGDEEDVNYLYNTRSNISLESGDRIIPLYEKTDFSTNMTTTDQGKEIVFGNDTTVSLRTLPSGYYLTTAVIMDQRGDRYYSCIVGADLADGSIREWKLDSRFYGRDYE